MIVLLNFTVLSLWFGYFLAVDKGWIKPIVFNQYLKLAGGLVIFFCFGACFKSAQSFLSGEIGNSDFDYRRGSLLRSEKHPGLAMYVATRWFGFVEEGSGFFSVKTLEWIGAG